MDDSISGYKPQRACHNTLKVEAACPPSVPENAAVIGEVRHTRNAFILRAGKIIRANKHDLVYATDGVQVGHGGRMKIKLNDKEKSIFSVGPDSEFSFKDLKKPDGPPGSMLTALKQGTLSSVPGKTLPKVASPGPRG